MPHEVIHKVTTTYRFVIDSGDDDWRNEHLDEAVHLVSDELLYESDLREIGVLDYDVTETVETTIMTS